MHTIIHRLVVVAILLAGFSIAQFYPAAPRTERSAPTVESHVLSPIEPVIERDDSLPGDTFPVRTPAKPVASPEALGMFHELTVAVQEQIDKPESRMPTIEKPASQERSRNTTKRNSGPRRLPRITRDTQGREASHLARPETQRVLPSIKQGERRKRRRGRLTTHRIADGDDLPLLAGKYLLDESRHMEIFHLNRHLLLRPDLLPVGKEIQVYDERK